MSRGSKRANDARTVRWGDGFVRPRPRKDRPGYEARWPERNERGATVWRSKMFDTEDEAYDHLRTIGRDRRAGRYVPESRLTVAEHLDDYLRRGRQRWTTNTQATYGLLVRKQIVPALGGRRLVELTPRMVQLWIDDLVSAGYSAALIENARIVLSGAMKEALQLGIIGANPVSGVKVPARRKTARQVWALPDAARVLAHVRDDVLLSAFYQTALTTGMRPGELRALQWDDIDAERRTITCRRSMTRDAQFRTRVGETTKTGRTRVIAVPAATIAALRRLRAAQRTRQLAHAAWHDTGLVFDRGDGTFLPLTTLERLHTQTIAAAGVPTITLHGLRHSAATLMLAQGANVKVVSEILGHASITTTLDIYAHVSTDLQRAVVDALGDTLGLDADERHA